MKYVLPILADKFIAEALDIIRNAPETLDGKPVEWVKAESIVKRWKK